MTGDATSRLTPSFLSRERRKVQLVSCRPEDSQQFLTSDRHPEASNDLTYPASVKSTEVT